jgi:pimeloyl-ACP methyl ester carboxylesterase
MKPDPIEFEVAQGITLRGLVWTGAAPTILLAHGSNQESDLDDWDDLIPYLLQMGSSIIAIDLRGHGMSDGEPEHSTTHSDLRSVVTRLGNDSLIALAMGTSVPALIEMSGDTAMAGMVLISPELGNDLVPRSGNIPKLLVGGTLDPEMRAAIRGVQQVSIGPTLTVHVPTTARGKELFGGELGITCREHILNFIRERKLEVDRRSATRKGVRT